MSQPAAKLPFVTKFGFGAGDFAFNLFWSGTSLFLFFVYTDVMGLPPWQAGLVYAVGMVWDAVTDPAMGVIADKTRTRFGRYRPYILFGCVPLAISYGLAFWNPGFAGWGLFAWAMATHVVFRTAYTIVGIPYSSLQARLSQDPDERATLAGFRMMGAATGALTVAILTRPLIELLGGGDAQRGWALAGVGVGALSIGVFVFCFFAMKEPPEDPAAPKAAPISWSAELAAFFGLFGQNGPLVRVFITIMSISVALTFFGKVIPYHFTYALDAPDDFFKALVIPGALMLLMVPVWVQVARRTSKRTTWMLGASIAGSGYLAFFLVDTISVPLTLALCAWIGVGGSAFGVMFWSMLPDTVEYGEAKTGVRHEAKVFGFASFAQKAALGVNALALGLLLELTGYVANQPQTPQTLDGLKAIMALIPLAGVLVSVAALWRYPLDAKTHRALQAEIAARGPATPPAAQASSAE